LGVFCFVLWRRRAPAPGIAAPNPAPYRAQVSASILGRFWTSHAEGLRFLAAPAQRPSLALLVGA
jgi:hypothetical protein